MTDYTGIITEFTRDEQKVKSNKIETDRLDSFCEGTHCNNKSYINIVLKVACAEKVIMPGLGL